MIHYFLTFFLLVFHCLPLLLRCFIFLSLLSFSLSVAFPLPFFHTFFTLFSLFFSSHFSPRSLLLLRFLFSSLYFSFIIFYSILFFFFSVLRSSLSLISFSTPYIINSKFISKKNNDNILEYKLTVGK